MQMVSDELVAHHLHLDPWLSAGISITVCTWFEMQMVSDEFVCCNKNPSPAMRYLPSADQTSSRPAELAQVSSVAQMHCGACATACSRTLVLNSSSFNSFTSSKPPGKGAAAAPDNRILTCWPFGCS